MPKTFTLIISSGHRWGTRGAALSLLTCISLLAPNFLSFPRTCMFLSLSLSSSCFSSLISVCHLPDLWRVWTTGLHTLPDLWPTWTARPSTSSTSHYAVLHPPSLSSVWPLLFYLPPPSPSSPFRSCSGIQCAYIIEMIGTWCCQNSEKALFLHSTEKETETQSDDTDFPSLYRPKTRNLGPALKIYWLVLILCH